MSNSKNSSSISSRDVLSHVHTYGLTTLPALTRVVFGGHKSRAKSSVREIIAAGQLYRHDTILTTESEPPGWTGMVVDYAVLAFCCLGGRQRPLLPPDKIEQLTTPVTQKAGLPPVRKARCYLRSSRRIAMLRVYPKPLISDFDRNLAVQRLQEFVNSSSFRPWAYFAMNGELVISYLVPRGPHVRELMAWLRRKPLVSRLVEPAALIPVDVYDAERRPRWKRPDKNKDPKGSLFPPR